MTNQNLIAQCNEAVIHFANECIKWQEQIEVLSSTMDESLAVPLGKKLCALSASREEMDIYRRMFAANEECSPMNVGEICRKYINDYNSDKNHKKYHNMYRKKDAREVRTRRLNQILIAPDIETPEQKREAWTLYNYSPLFRLAFTQILDNAVKYSMPNTTIDMQMEVHDEYKQITFSNFGPRLEEDEAKRVLEHEYRGINAQYLTTEGHGLGLSIVKEIADSQEVQVIVESGEEASNSYDNVPYELFSIILVFPHRDTPASAPAFLQDISDNTAIGIYLHEMNRVIRTCYRKLSDICNWATSNRQELPEEMFFICNCMRVSYLHMQALFFYIDYLLLPQDMCVYGNPLEKTVSLDTILNNICVAYRDEIEYDKDFLPSFSFPAKELLLYIYLNGIVYHLLEHRKVKEEKLEMNIDIETSSVVFRVKSGFNDLGRNEKPVSLAEMEHLDCHRWGFYNSILQNTTSGFTSVINKTVILYIK